GPGCDRGPRNDRALALLCGRDARGGGAGDVRLQLGTLNIAVPPGETGSAEGRWVAPLPMNVVLLSPHSHKPPPSVDLDVVRAGPDAGRILQTVDYEHPTVERFVSPMRLEAGDGLHWTCHYTNAAATMLHFGITSEDEMCFTIGAFYL